MNALLNLEDIGDALSCCRCNQSQCPLFRCNTCLGTVSYCQGCIVKMHQEMPLHRVSLWDPTAGCFQSTSLAELGLVLNLSHNALYSVCPNPSSLHGITVIHTNGIHNISVQFCNCPQSQSADLQLFNEKLFSASTRLPQTAFSFAVLEQFRYYHLESKGSAYVFMNTLCRLTDDTGCIRVEVLSSCSDPHGDTEVAHKGPSSRVSSRLQAVELPSDQEVLWSIWQCLPISATHRCMSRMSPPWKEYSSPMA